MSGTDGGRRLFEMRESSGSAGMRRAGTVATFLNSVWRFHG